MKTIEISSLDKYNKIKTLSNSFRVNCTHDSKVVQFQLYMDGDNVWIANDQLNKTFIKQVLCDIVDHAKLECE